MLSSACQELQTPIQLQSVYLTCCSSVLSEIRSAIPTHLTCQAETLIHPRLFGAKQIKLGVTRRFPAALHAGGIFRLGCF